MNEVRCGKCKSEVWWKVEPLSFTSTEHKTVGVCLDCGQEYDPETGYHLTSRG